MCQRIPTAKGDGVRLNSSIPSSNSTVESPTNAAARDCLRAATGQAEPAAAAQWIAEGRPLADGSDARDVLQALLALAETGKHQRDAIAVLSRALAVSQLDSADVLFDVDHIRHPASYEETLGVVASYCPSGGLDSISPEVVIRAQADDPRVLEALAAVGGMSLKELTGRITGGAGSSEPTVLDPSLVRRAFGLIDEAVTGSGPAAWPGTARTRPVELLGDDGGWAAVEAMRRGGVSYGTLLAQRVVGGAWIAHRNRTSSQLAPLLAGRLRMLLDDSGVSYVCATSLGGDTAAHAVMALGGTDKQVGILALDRAGRPAAGVIITTARDHGTARANALRLLQTKHPASLPVAVLLAGPGWAKRNETADLAEQFGGRIFSDVSLDELAAEIARYVRLANGGSD